MDENEIDNEYTSEIVCPYCGHSDPDSYEYDFDNEPLLITCSKCDMPFYAYQNIEISYSTEKPNYGICKNCR